MVSSAINLLLVTVLSFSHAANLPTYWKACDRTKSVAVLSACALEQGRNGLSELLKGDASINVPSLLPLVVPQIILAVGPNLEFKFTNAEFYNLQTTIINKMIVDLEKNKIVVDLNIPTLSLISQYKVNGQILILPIVGEGPSNLTISGGNYVLSADLEYHTKKKGVKHVRIVNINLDFTVKHMSFNFENLFNGDPRLGGELNKFFTENWKEVYDELKPALGTAIGEIVGSIGNGVVGKVPFDKLFSTGV